jgi:hypothetical protein
MSQSTAAPRKLGRPPLPKEKHRRTINVRLDPMLLQQLTAAAAGAGHSISREIELRCQQHELLMRRLGEEAAQLLEGDGRADKAAVAYLIIKELPAKITNGSRITLTEPIVVRSSVTITPRHARPDKEGDDQ